MEVDLTWQTATPARQRHNPVSAIGSIKRKVGSFNRSGRPVPSPLEPPARARSQSDFKKVISCSFSLAFNRTNPLLDRIASPLCLKIASENVNDSPSCINRSRVRTPPQRRCTHAVCRGIKTWLHRHIVAPEVFLHGYDDSISCSHVMQQEIAERMKFSAPQGCRDGKCSAVDRGSRGSRFSSHMARRASDGIEQLRSALCIGRVCKLRVSRRRLGSSHKPCKAIDVRQAICLGRVLRVLNCVAQRGEVRRRSRLVIPISFRYASPAKDNRLAC